MLTLIRDVKKDNGVMGKLYLNGAFICYTLENTAYVIPEGRYTIENSKSPKFKRELPLLHNAKVTACRGIRIHRGNSEKDSCGCVLVGMARNTSNATISESANAELMVTMICRNCNELVITEE